MKALVARCESTAPRETGSPWKCQHQGHLCRITGGLFDAMSYLCPDHQDMWRRRHFTVTELTPLEAANVAD
jgi:hypothetical protein